ncbi:putative metal-dependent HD superfamily phosphohydrolase [Georgenia soli]|uniref:Putative metal-dependent HD superfamily phosphohydrolase n=1 Tax=Georgenia soli TaxID=638953 RepID=A0A2A9EK35_9MICO|nr:putative metal-dependent HD superfamily phosphohydrolase [Georgenia soli]
MGVIDVPQWLPAAFVRSVLAVGATAPREEIEATCRRLLERWQEPDRHFHNLKHLVDVLARVDELAEETHHPDTVRLAAWYHGAVFSSTPGKAYSRSGGEDEGASAELAREELGALGVPPATRDRIAELILNLKRHEIRSRDIDCLALSDADLAVLAADPQHYQAYRKAVRAEYAHLPARHYVEARLAIVTKLLARRNLFVSPMGAQWEDAARENLSAELARLQAELAAMGEAGPEESVAAAEAAQGEVVEESHRRDDTGSHVFTAPVRAATEAPADSALPAGPGASMPSGSGASATSGDEAARPAPAAKSAADAGPAARPTWGPVPGQGRGPGAATPDAVPSEVAPAGAVTPGTAIPGTVTPAAVTPGAVTPGSTPTPSEAAAERGQRPTRTSSLESEPDDLAARPRAGAETTRATRDAVARSSRELIEQAARDRRERADRERLQRERRLAARAEREQMLVPVRERRASAASTLTPPTPPSPGTPDSAGRRVTPEQPRGTVEPVPPLVDAQPVTGQRPTEDGAPQHGMEREPDFFDRPRRKKDKRR